MKNTYDPAEYWRQRLSAQTLNLASVGYIGLGMEYNQWLYRRRFMVLNNGIRRLNINPSGKSLLDVGVGSGAYVPFWQKYGVANLIGLDITEVSVSTLQTRYNEFKFIRADISGDVSILHPETFNIVTAFDILFHIVNDDEFSNSIRNLSNSLEPGGWLIISDSICANAWGPYYHEHHRSYSRYKSELLKNQLRIIHVEPIFYIMMTPLCGSKILNQLVSLETRVISKFAAKKSTAWINHFIGVCLLTIDTISSFFSSSGPGLKYIFIKKYT